MSIAWLQPLAWWGLAALAVPLAIHLLARQRSRRVRFPSLRFLQATRLAALRRRTVSEWPLLVVRLLIVMVAVAALASPVIVSDSRRRAWDARVSRAIVVVPAPEAASAADREALTRLVEDERAAAFVAAVFTPAIVADGVRGAVQWLGRQEPSRREIVIAGDLRADAVTARDLGDVPSSVGIRLLPTGAGATPRGARVQVSEVTPAGVVAMRGLALRLEDTATVVTNQGEVATATPAIQVRASPAQQAHAEAILRAVLAEGVRAPRDAGRRVVIELTDATAAVAGSARTADGSPLPEAWMRRAVARVPDLSCRDERGDLVIEIGAAATDPRAVHRVARAVEAAWADPLDALEPRRMPPSAIAGLSRPAGPVPDDVQPIDEGDRRVFWVAALLLLGFEHVIRRTMRSGPAEAVGHSPADREARVA